MIARIGTGSGFGGVGQYLLHDKDHAKTSERVAWTATRNTVSGRAAGALNEMQWTSDNSNNIKQMYGGSMAGRKHNRNSVLHGSLSWHPEQKPTREEMQAAADEAIRAQGLEEHQAVYIAHNDEKHRHIHFVVNLINPMTGRKATQSMSKRKLSTWAHGYEKREGKLYCQEREKNQQRLKQREKNVRYRETPHDRKAEIKAMYEQSKDRAEFAAKARAAGLELGQHRKRIIVVDREGKNYNLARNVDGKTKAIREKFGDMDDLPDVKAIREAQATQERERTDRAAERIEATTGRQKAPKQDNKKLKPEDEARRQALENLKAFEKSLKNPERGHSRDRGRDLWPDIGY